MVKEEVIRQGAEAKIILSELMGRRVIVKHRIPKAYRLKEIDSYLRSYRTKDEAKLIHESRGAGVPVPVIYDVDVVEGKITMEYLYGSRVKDLLRDMHYAERENLCIEIGRNIAKLHRVNIIHGDLTTSNMVMHGGRLHFIDFGLGSKTEEIESRGVDLHVLMEALESTHSEHPECFDNVFRGYEEICGKNARLVKHKIDDIIRRGRYRS